MLREVIYNVPGSHFVRHTSPSRRLKNKTIGPGSLSLSLRGRACDSGEVFLESIPLSLSRTPFTPHLLSLALAACVFTLKGANPILPLNEPNAYLLKDASLYYWLGPPLHLKVD